MTSASIVTPALVKELREKTGVGMAKCKEALDQASGDMEEAIASLAQGRDDVGGRRKKGVRQKRVLVLRPQTNDVVAVAEVNAETDFVVKNDRFQEFCHYYCPGSGEQKPCYRGRVFAAALFQRPFSYDRPIPVVADPNNRRKHPSSPHCRVCQEQGPIYWRLLSPRWQDPYCRCP